MKLDDSTIRKILSIEGQGAFSNNQRKTITKIMKINKNQGAVTKAQFWVVFKIIKNVEKRQRGAKDGKQFHLYAISDTTAVKLGYSADIIDLKKAVSTGNPNPVTVVWSSPVGINEDEARRTEDMLHELCGAFWIRGEWFTMACLPLVEAFSVEDETNKILDEVMISNVNFWT